MNRVAHEHRQRELREAIIRWQRPLCAYAASLLGGDSAAAEDAVQETFLRLCRLETAALPDPLAPWLFRVCRTRVIDMQRALRPSASLAASAAAADPGPSPEQCAEQREQANELDRLVHQLPPRQQELLRLRLQAGLSYREIAEATGMTVSNVGYQLHHAVRVLRERFGTVPAR